MNLKKKILFLVFLCLSCSLYAQQNLPRIEEYNGIKQLIVNGKPYIMLAGELHNSSSSSLEYMKPVWDKLQKMNLNTVIATVSWELVEPQEGKYDFSLVEDLINDARKNNLKLVFIWFGTWKNAVSTYVPEWVKTDLTRFPRMKFKPENNSDEFSAGGGVFTKAEQTVALSAWGDATMKADARAFAELMRFIKKIDSAQQTVLMIQVENETGVLGTSRDYLPAAQQTFAQQVPEELLNYLRQHESEKTNELKQMMQSTGNRTSGTWQEMFGYGADEVFMAWHIARYVNYVVKAGKQAYSLPMYANAWLDPNYYQSLKNDYPCGGPLSKMMTIWRAAAPDVDLLAPDIYADDFKWVCAQYTFAGNPLFIPETNPDIRASANVYYALGQYNAICYSPFAIEGFNDADSKALGENYGLLSGFLPFWAKNSGKSKSVGFTSTPSGREMFELGDYRIEVNYHQQRDIGKGIPGSCGLILCTAPGEFYVTGRNISVNFLPLEGEKKFVEILSHEEGKFVNGVWQAGRRMNGDELYIQIGDQPEFRLIRIHKYQ